MPAIDFLKFVSVLAVVVIHIVSHYPSTPLLVVFDQLARFSVPMFVSLSGYGLTVGYGLGKINWTNFLWRRLIKLLPWYLFFATVAILTVTFVFHQDKALYGDLPVWKLYLFGRADYHLYFVPMIAQLYLLYLLLRRVLSFKLVILTFIWQIFWYTLIGQQTEILGNNNRVWPDQQQYLFFGAWVFYFVLGMYLARFRLPRVIGVLALALGGFWAITDSLSLISSGIDALVATRFTRLPVLLYSTGAILVATSLRLPTGKIIARLGSLSYIIYLSHTLILRIIL